MTLAKRLNEMERQIRTLEEWKEAVEASMDGEADDAPPSRDLDGDEIPGERDQTESLG